MFKKLLFRLLTVTMLVATAGQVQAAAMYFTDRASFDAATGGGLSFEGFEGDWTNTDGVASFDGFKVSETGSGNLNDLFSAASGGTSFSVSEEVETVWYTDNGSSVGTFYDFSPAVTAFGLDLTFTDEYSPETISIVAIGGSVNDSITLYDEVHAFWGVIDSSGIDSVSFDANGTYYLGFDAVSYGIAVPEPSGLILLTIGAVGLLAYGRRRRRAA